uniref:Uncharacterized protein n=1 Tax=Panagrellus redivivus TaxID=6233 RepID=A0A7E4UQV5_PANRE
MTKPVEKFTRKLATWKTSHRERIHGTWIGNGWTRMTRNAGRTEAEEGSSSTCNKIVWPPFRDATDDDDPILPSTTPDDRNGFYFAKDVSG